MCRQGAELKNGKWHHNGNLVELAFIVRSDDNIRMTIATYIIEQLEDIGFVIDRRDMSGSEASPIWRLSEPADGLWHLYTGGWNIFAAQALQGHLLDHLYTPRTMTEPLWQSYTPNLDLLNVAERLNDGVFDSLSERRDMFKAGLELALEYSPRIWLTTTK